jgi:hypothetical protein
MPDPPNPGPVGLRDRSAAGTIFLLLTQPFHGNGSSRNGILRMVLGECLLIGIPCALVASRLIAHVLFGVGPGDPLSFAVPVTALLTVGAAAGLWPARRKSHL